jgi:putative membrane protein|tara:strand:- start:787 stop:1332 length:546 start_codon:yes stop_codon:yes gene_type:complete
MKGNPKDRFVIPIIVSLSIIVPIAVASLFLLPEDWKLQFGNANFRSLPFFHAILNGSTAILLLVAFGLIKTKNVAFHRLANILAFSLSAVFLVSYVVSHISNPDAHFGGQGWVRYLYFFILITHITLSIPVLPLAMLSIYRGWNNQISAHKKLVKWTFPIWMYVAITGVLVYIFMAPYYPM